MTYAGYIDELKLGDCSVALNRKSISV